MTMNSQISPYEAATELLNRREARRSMLSFVQYVKPDYVANWHHQTLCDHLDDFAHGHLKRLMVFMPPQHGKSELVSRKLPAFILGLNPDTKIIASSFGASLIESMNREVQRTIDSPEYATLFPETRLNDSNVRVASGGSLRNNEIFEVVGHQGQYKCAGIGGALTGFPADVAIIDDPYKDYEEAKSQVNREKVWEWYTSVLLSRTHKDTRILLTLTRWHEEDLAARLLEAEPDQWHVLKLPAICEDEAAPNEQRVAGEALWPERFPVETLLGREALNPHQFEALYQQSPSPARGSFFQTEWFPIESAAPRRFKRLVRYWDVAGAAPGKGDWTVGLLMGEAFPEDEGKFWILHVDRFQKPSNERNAAIKQRAELDRQQWGQSSPLKTFVEQPPGIGKEAVDNIIRLLAGYNAQADPVNKDKETRAEPMQSQARAGNMRMLSDRSWNGAFLETLRVFPNGKHDDDVDAASGAFNKLNVPIVTPLEPPPKSRIRR